MYRLLAIAKYDDRYVIPKAHAELGAQLMEQQGGGSGCSLDFEGGPGNCGAVRTPAVANQDHFMLKKSLPVIGQTRPS
jgi:nitrate reductase beta subunit